MYPALPFVAHCYVLGVLCQDYVEDSVGGEQIIANATFLEDRLRSAKPEKLKQWEQPYAYNNSKKVDPLDHTTKSMCDA